MAKKSKVVKNIHRQKLVDKYKNKRKELLTIVKSPKTSIEEKRLAYMKLDNPIKVNLGRSCRMYSANEQRPRAESGVCCCCCCCWNANAYLMR